MATKEDQELFRAAEQWLTENPGKTLAEWRKETGYTGPPLKLRNRKGEPVRVSFKGQSTAAQTRRAAKEKPKTEEEAKYLRETKAQARQQSQSTEALFVSEGKPSIAEHDVRLASGGTSEYMSVSDPEFKLHKDNVEAAAYRRFGDKVVVDIDDISGDVRLIPAKFHNKFQPTSEQPGIDIPMGTDIKEGLDLFERTEFKSSRLVDSLDLTPAQRNQLDRAPTLELKDELLTKFKSMGADPLTAMLEKQQEIGYAGLKEAPLDVKPSQIEPSMKGAAKVVKPKLASQVKAILQQNSVEEGAQKLLKEAEEIAPILQKAFTKLVS